MSTNSVPPNAGSGTPPVPWATHAVLVVDDDAEFGRTVVDALSDRDIDPVAVQEPREALALARRRPFAVAVVDLIMPGMDGLELARELKKANSGTEVVVLTGHADMHSAIEGIRHDVFDYLQKGDLAAVRLRRAVRAAIARSELRAENQRLLASLRESARRLALLGEIGARLSAHAHLDALVQDLTRSARELLDVEAVRVLLTETNDLGDLTIRAAYGDGEVATGGLFGPGDSIAGHVIKTGRPIRLDSAGDHPGYSARCDDLGASLPGFVCVPLQRPGLDGVLMVAGRARAFDDEDVSLLAGLARQGAVAIENARAAEASRNFFTHTCEMLVGLLDAEDVHYRGHGHAVAALTDMVTRRLGLAEEERRTLHFAALLHDVGKLRLPAGLLREGRSLTAAEREAVRRHPALGVEILRPISRWRPLEPAIHSHHERWDGTGYPRGLAGDAIPMGGRIIAVAEAFEVMTRQTPFSPARTPEEALAEIEACSGSQFDPLVARLFVEEYRRNRDRLVGLGTER